MAGDRPKRGQRGPSLTLTSDYLAQPPLWDDHGGHLGFERLGADVGRDLEEALTGWQEHFDDHFRYDRRGGWDTAEAVERYATEGRRLHRELERRLGREVALDLWPVEGER